MCLCMCVHAWIKHCRKYILDVIVHAVVSRCFMCPVLPMCSHAKLHLQSSLLQKNLASSNVLSVHIGVSEASKEEGEQLKCAGSSACSNLGINFQKILKLKNFSTFQHHLENTITVLCFSNGCVPHGVYEPAKNCLLCFSPLEMIENNQSPRYWVGEGILNY